jgi:hypothetical protein
MKIGKLNDINEMCNILENFQNFSQWRETSKPLNLSKLSYPAYYNIFGTKNPNLKV